jgi:hypothetical protein
MAPVIKRYKKEGIDAGIELLEDVWENVEDEFLDNKFFKTYIWYEAQARSGRNDEEWSIALFEFLLQKREEENPREIKNLTTYTYILMDNLAAKYNEIGMMARSRTYIMRRDKHLRTYLRLDTSCTSYPDKGPIFSFLPEARKREFPVRDTDLSFSDTNTGEAFDYAYIYGIRNIAGQILAEGDWVRAAELSQWIIQYTDYYAQTTKYNDRFKEVCGESLPAFENLATIANLHGYPEEALRMYQEFLKRMKKKYKVRPSKSYYAKLEILKLQIELGNPPEDALKIADKACKKIGSDRYYTSRLGALAALIDRAHIYYDLGEKETGWKIVNDQLKKYKKDKNPRLQIIILNAAIDMALADGGTHPDLERWFIQVLTYTRTLGNKLDERPLYKKYAAFLLLQGRYQEAFQIQRELVRLNRALSLTKPLKESEAKLEEIKKLLEKNEQKTPTSVSNVKPDENPTATTTKTSNNNPVVTLDQNITITPSIDLQPSQSASAALSGHAAIGRFYLFNPASITQEGTLMLKGCIDSVQWKSKTSLALSASPSFASITNLQPVSLEPETFCTIDVTALPTADGKSTTVEYTWVPKNKEQDQKTATWDYSFDNSGTQTAVIDAHNIQSNPYYLLPIHHTIQRVNASNNQIVDFTITSSIPTRIEIYNTTTGKLMATDANGDGDFLDRGDFIAADENFNNWPDVTLARGERLSSIVLYIQPNTTGKDQELTIKLKTKEGWRIDSVDTIRTIK